LYSLAGTSLPLEAKTWLVDCRRRRHGAVC
jgi:hypothetical protein